MAGKNTILQGWPGTDLPPSNGREFPGPALGRRVLGFLVRAGGSDFRQNCTSQPMLRKSWVDLGGNFELPVAPRAVELGLGRSQEVKGSPELQGSGPRALVEPWMATFRLRHFLSSLVVVCPPFRASRSLQEMSSSVQGGLRSSRDPRAPKRWPESSRRGLDDDFLQIEELFCQVWSFSEALWSCAGG